MWNSYKIYRAAKDLRRCLSETNRIDMDLALDTYGVDSGSSLVKVFFKYFKRDFMREFWNGNDKDFNKAIQEHEALL